MNPVRGMLYPISVLCEGKVISPAVNTNHIVAEKLQILNDPVNVIEPDTLRDVSIGLLFICLVEIFISRPVEGSLIKQNWLHSRLFMHIYITASNTNNKE